MRWHELKRYSFTLVHIEIWTKLRKTPCDFLNVPMTANDQRPRVTFAMYV